MPTLFDIVSHEQSHSWAKKLYNLSCLIHGPKIGGPCFECVAFQQSYAAAEKVLHLNRHVAFQRVAFQQTALYRSSENSKSDHTLI